MVFFMPIDFLSLKINEERKAIQYFIDTYVCMFVFVDAFFRRKLGIPNGI